MKILVLNSGSSSIKFKVFRKEGLKPLASGMIERIGEETGRVRFRRVDAIEAGEGEERSLSVPDHRKGFAIMQQVLKQAGVIAGSRDLYGIGHRVVHGGERFREPVVITPEVVKTIRDLVPLAPLHNPSNLAGIEVALEYAAGVPQVAVFDTAFHQGMPEHAFIYALPLDLYHRHHVRRYGFHGTSHRYVAREAAAYLGRPLESLNMITLHLGNGASAAAIEKGRCVETSMGMTPLEGLVMGTRSGDLDPAIVFYLARVTGKGLDELDHLLNHQSGLAGLCGENDMREVERRMQEGDARAALALEVFCHRLKKYIGAYLAVLGRVDCMVFTGGIGENSTLVRLKACEGLSALGIEIDPERNGCRSPGIKEIHSQGSATKVLVVPTNEELEIARQTLKKVSEARAQRMGAAPAGRAVPDPRRTK